VKHWICPRCTTQGAAVAPGPESCPSCEALRPAGGWLWLLDEGDVLDRHYRVERVLAVTQAGPTYLARELDADGEPIDPRVAIETLFVDRAEGPFARRLATAAQLLRQLPHRHIVQLRGFVERSGHPPYLITRYEAGGTLADHLERVGPLSDDIALGVVTQLARALTALHRHGLAHLHLAPANIVLETPVGADTLPHCRLAGFELVGVAKGYGTPEFAAPEQLEPHPVTPKADVFAVGALLWWMVTGAPLVVCSDRSNPTRCLDEWVTALAGRPRGTRSPEVERWLDATLRTDALQRPPMPALIDEGDATLAGPDVGASPLASAPHGLDPIAADNDDPDAHATEINVPWSSMIGAGSPSGAEARAPGASSGPTAPGSSVDSAGSALASTPGSALTSWTGSYSSPSGPRTLASGVSAVRHPPVVTQSRSGVRRPPSPARSVVTSAALVVAAFLIAAAGLVAGYVAMTTWGGL